MKKLLALILVLGMASLAGAGLQTLVPGLDVDVDTDAKTITFIAPAAAATDGGSVIGLGLGVMVPDAGAIGFVSTAFGTGGEGMPGADLGYPEGSWAAYSGVNLTGNGNIGVLAVFSYAGDPTKVDLFNEEMIGLGNSEVSFRDGSTVSLAGMSIIIPEPATMALLGLGGLFLRRRK